MKKLVALLLLAAVSASLFTFDAAASESTAYTFTQSVNKEEMTNVVVNFLIN